MEKMKEKFSKIVFQGKYFLIYRRGKDMRLFLAATLEQFNKRLFSLSVCPTVCNAYAAKCEATSPHLISRSY